MAPFIGFFHTLPTSESGEQAGESHFCGIPPGPIERLNRFVGEVQDVAPIKVAVVGRGGKQQIRNGNWRMPGSDR